MKRPYLYMIAAAALIVAGFLFLRSQFSCRRLSCLSIDGFNKYQLNEVFQENDHAFRASYKNSDAIMKVETIYNLDKNDARQYIDAGVAKIEGVYTESLVPYPGVASQQTGCQTKFQPLLKKVTTNTEISYFTGYLNSNLTFGTCIEEQITHKGILAFLYCPKSKQGYQIEIVATKDSFEKESESFIKTVESITCL